VEDLQSSKKHQDAYTYTASKKQICYVYYLRIWPNFIPARRKSGCFYIFFNLIV